MKEYQQEQAMSDFNHPPMADAAKGEEMNHLRQCRQLLNRIIRNGTVEDLELLLDGNLNLNKPVDGITPAYVAYDIGDPRKLEILFAHGANPTIKYGERRETLRNLAERSGNSEMIMITRQAEQRWMNRPVGK